MEDERASSPPKSFEELFTEYWQLIVVDHAPAGRIEYAVALLIKSVERLKVSTEESSRQANRLSSMIKNLTWALIGLTAAAVVLAGLSLWALLHAPR